MYETHYRRPKDLAEAAKMFAGASEPKYIAGGQTLLPTMKQRLAAPSDVIDLSRLAELRGISAAGGTVTIGAGVTHAEVANSDAVKKAIPALAKLAGLIGDPAVRHKGTIGGSVANNDPGADYPAAVLGLGATIHTNRRTIKADAFFTGLFTTALEDGEVVTKVAFPEAGAGGLREVPQSCVTLCHDRRVRVGGEGRRSPRRGHRGGQQGRVPLGRDGEGARRQLLGRRDPGRHDRRRRHARRPARLGRRTGRTW